MDRRTFLMGVGVGVGAGALSACRAFGASPGETIGVAVMGVNGRGAVLARAFQAASNASVRYICDVDRDVMAEVAGGLDGRPKEASDFRRALDDTDVDALVIAAPDHWHATATLLALQAGKHVYVEKPCGHNPREGELLVEAQRHHGKVVMMGNQQRSGARSIAAIAKIREGIIGRPYFARAWYANTRESIGRGKAAAVPKNLDYDLWQGPAPHTPYRDNVVHYNWHWFRRWGTGEICNNGTHEIDVCRWALGVDLPTRVTSAGGRYHFDDDWEFYDTQIASFEFGGGATITWEGRSCNGRSIEGRDRGVSIHGEKGTVVIDREGYVVYDNDEREVEDDIGDGDEATLDTRGGGDLTDAHVANFLNTIRGIEKSRTPIEEGHKSVLLCHLGNIAQHTGRALACNPDNGHIENDAEAMELWSRQYEPGWEPKV